MPPAPGPALDHIPTNSTDLALDDVNVVAHGAGALTGGSWDISPQLTIPDLWDASGFNDYSGFMA
jgi:hypothetical protein